jgi:hypothetical protein
MQTFEKLFYGLFVEWYMYHFVARRRVSIPRTVESYKGIAMHVLRKAA